MARYRRVARKPAPQPVVQPIDYGSLTKADLVNLANSLKLDTSGTKAELIARLQS